MISNACSCTTCRVIHHEKRDRLNNFGVKVSVIMLLAFCSSVDLFFFFFSMLILALRDSFLDLQFLYVCNVKQLILLPN